jgi:hypothetical protein
MARLTGKRLILFIVAVTGVPMLLLGGSLFVVFFVIYPFPGDPIASVDVKPDQPFSLEYTSDGEEKRAFFDVDCTGCRSRIGHGTFEVWVAGKRVSTHTYHHSEIGNRDVLEGHLLFDIDAQPVGTMVQLKGVVSVPPPTLIGVWPPSSAHDGPPPKIDVCKVWVAK